MLRKYRLNKSGESDSTQPCGTPGLTSINLNLEHNLTFPIALETLTSLRKSSYESYLSIAELSMFIVDLCFVTTTTIYKRRGKSVDKMLYMISRPEAEQTGYI